jgi:uncharacterized SAM-binding protein YcdF (DUF218 family)
MKINFIYYIIGTVIFIAIYEYSKIDVMFLLCGFGIGLFLHSWVNKMFKDFTDNFYRSETQNRKNKLLQLQKEKVQLEKEQRELEEIAK